MTSISAIYVILNKKNDKIYIGSAYNLKKRWYEHRHYLNKSCHQNPHLQAAWNKYGAKAFQFKVLEHCPIEQLKDREQHYLDIYMPKGMCYNIALDAVAPMRGRKITEETRLKISENNKNRPPMSDETKLKMSEAQKLRWARKRVIFNDGDES